MYPLTEESTELPVQGGGKGGEGAGHARARFGENDRKVFKEKGEQLDTALSIMILRWLRYERANNNAKARPGENFNSLRVLLIRLFFFTTGSRVYFANRKF